MKKKIGESVTAQRGYLFSMATGKLEVYPGEVTTRLHVWEYINPVNAERHVETTTSSVFFKDHEYVKVRISPEEGVIMNRLLWLSEKDIERAKKTFIKYYEDKICAKHKKIWQYDASIQYLAKLGAE